MVDGSSEWICEYILTWGITHWQIILPIFFKQSAESRHLFACFPPGHLRNILLTMYGKGVFDSHLYKQSALADWKTTGADSKSSSHDNQSEWPTS